MKTTIRYHYTSTGMAKIKNMTIPSVDEDGTLNIAGGNVKSYRQQFWKRIL